MAAYLERTLLDPLLPWDIDPIERARFKRILLIGLVLSLVFSIAVPLLTVEKPSRLKVSAIPPRLVKMVLAQKKQVKPLVKVEEKIEEKFEEKKPEELKKPEQKPLPPKKPSAREVAKKHMTVFDDLAELRRSDLKTDLAATGQSRSGQGQAVQTTRSLISSQVNQGSGGIQVAAASQSQGGGALKGQSLTQVSSDIEVAVAKASAPGKSGARQRSAENIQLTFDQHKPAIFSLYHKALRSNPGLQGNINFRLVISPSGVVEVCQIVSTELKDEALEKRLIAKIKRIDFGALDVASWDDTYLINFFPG